MKSSIGIVVTRKPLVARFEYSTIGSEVRRKLKMKKSTNVTAI